MGVAPPDLLEAIVGATRHRVAAQRSREAPSVVAARAALRRPDPGAFRQALARPSRVNVIAECKRRSPSRGVLRAAYDPVAIATSYERAGAAAVSVLTEPAFFDGALSHLAAIRDAVRLPLLRKDFVVDEYQLLEARAAGADAVLLIVSALSDETLGSLLGRAADLELAALVEVHDVAEVRRAISAGADIIGVNNRNLRTLEVDTQVSADVAAVLPHDVVAVSESGLRSSADLARLRQAGYHAFLIGERFMTADDPGAALAALLEHEAAAQDLRP